MQLLRAELKRNITCRSSHRTFLAMARSRPYESFSWCEEFRANFSSEPMCIKMEAWTPQATTNQPVRLGTSTLAGLAF